MMTYVVAGTARDLPVDAERLSGLTWVGGVLWFADAGLDRLVAVDPQTGDVLHRIRCQGVGTGLTTLNAHLLPVVGPRRVLQAIDPETGNVLNEFANPRPERDLCGIEAAAAGVWVSYDAPGVLDRRNASDFGVIDTIAVSQAGGGITVTDRYIALSDYRRERIHLIDPKTKRMVITIGVNGVPTDLTWDGRWIWYCDYRTVQLRAIEVPGIVAAR